MENKKEQKKNSNKLKILKVVMHTIKKIPPTDDPAIYQKPNHQLSLEEFKALFVKEALKRTGCKSTKAAKCFLYEYYQAIIKEALQQMKDNINEDGISFFRYQSEDNKLLVKRYFKQKGMSQFS